MYSFWIALTLGCCSSPKAPERKNSKPKTPLDVFKGFWVWDNDSWIIKSQRTCKGTFSSQNPVSHPPLQTWVGHVWDGEEAPREMTWADGEEECKTNKKNHCLLCTLTVLLSHTDFALITELTMNCLQSAFFVLFLRQIYLYDFSSSFLFPSLFPASDYLF